MSDSSVPPSAPVALPSTAQIPQNQPITNFPIPNPPNTPPASTMAPPLTTSPSVVYAGFFIRLVATLIDGAIFLAIFFGTFMGLTFFMAAINDWLSGLILFAFSLFGVVVVTHLVYFFMEIKYGQTPGKMLTQIKIVNQADLSNPGFITIIKRNIGRYLSGAFLMIGYLACLWDPYKQTWHDKLASTLVVKV